MMSEQSASLRTTTTGQTQLSHRQVLVVFSGLMLGMLLASLDQTIVSTALPTIVGELGGLQHLSWIITAYLLTSTASMPLYGKLSDLFGRKKLFQFAIIVFLVGSALSGLAQSMLQLIGSRALQGLGAGGIITMSQATIGDIVSPRERGRYQGYMGTVFAVAAVAGPLLGGLFTDHLTWRWVFYINLPLGVLALVVTQTVLRLPFQRQKHPIDYLGSALMVAGLSSLLLVTSWGGTEYPLVVPADRRPERAGRAVALSVRGTGDARPGAAPATTAVRRAGVPGGRGDHVRPGPGHVRDRSFPAALLTSGGRRLGHDVGPAAGAPDARGGRHLGPRRPGDQQDREVPLLPDRRHGHHYARALPAVSAEHRLRLPRGVRLYGWCSASGLE